MNRRLARFLVAGVASAVMLILVYVLARDYVVGQVEKRVRDTMLECRAFHQYVQRDMHPAYYELVDDGRLPEGFYAPELLSSSYIVRTFQRHYNEERRQAGLPEVRYKMAAVNPRNPVNQATAFERDLVAWFNADKTRTSFRDIVKEDGEQYLLYARPFLTVEPRCLKCHGAPEDAPAELRETYNWTGGFNLKVGDVVAVELVRSPLEGEYNVAMVATAGFVLILGAGMVLLAFNTRLRTLVARRTQDLRESEQSYRLLAENMRDTIWTMDMNLRFTYFSPSVTQLGYSVEQATALSLDEFLTPASLEIASRTFAQELARQDPASREPFNSRTLELEIRRKDGSTLWAEVRMGFLRDDGEQLLGILGVARDITARVRAQEALQEAHDQLEQRVTERTAELRRVVNVMAGREVRMVELKDVIHKLRAQLEGAGLTPVADDPLLGGSR